MKETSPTFFTDSLSTLDAKFREKFAEPHRRLKAAIHKCQAQAYSQEGLSLEQSEQMARSCFLPLLLIRRHAQTMVIDAKDDFWECIKDLEERKGQKGYETARIQCL